MKMIKISGSQKEDVLLALYNHAKCGGPGYDSNPIMRVLAGMSRNGSREKAEQLILERNESGNFYFDNIDLGEGPRLLKVDLEGTEFNAEEFDEAHGEGQAARAINSIREAAFEKALTERFNPDELLELERLLKRSKNAIITHRQKPVALPNASSSTPESDKTDESEKAAPSASEKKRRIE